MAQVTLGSTNDSTLNSAPAIQAALDAVEARGGGVVRLTGGKYYIGNGGSGNQGLQIGSNTHLLLDQDAVIIRKFNSGGVEGAVIRNKHQDTVDQHIRVSGGTLDNEQGFAGNYLGFLNVDWLQIHDMRFLHIVDWNVSLRRTNDVVVSNLRMDSGTELQSAGIQISGGSRIVIADCDITCGDDCIALVIDTFQVSNISDVVISNCYLFSRMANALKLEVENAAAQPYTISRVAVNNIVAKTGVPDSLQSGGIIIKDGKLLKLITNVDIDGFYLDASESYTEPLVVEWATRVRMARIVIQSPRQRARIAGSDDVALIDCMIEIDPTRASGQQCLLVGQPAGSPPFPDGSCSHIRIVGGEYLVATQHAIHMGTDLFSVDHFEISNARIDSAVNNGILIWNSTNGIVIGNRIYNCGGLGIQELGANTNDNLILGNWIKFTAPMAGTINFIGSRTQVVRNWAAPGVVLPDTGGFRQTIDGWERIGIAATQAIIDMDPATQRFRSVRPGSITGLVVNTSQPRTGTSGLLRVTVYKNTGNAGAGGSTTGFFVEINTNNNRAFITQPVDVATSTFQPGDELYLRVETSGFVVASPPFNVFAALEIED